MTAWLGDWENNKKNLDWKSFLLVTDKRWAPRIDNLKTNRHPRSRCDRVQVIQDRLFAPASAYAWLLVSGDGNKLVKSLWSLWNLVITFHMQAQFCAEQQEEERKSFQSSRFSLRCTCWRGLTWTSSSKRWGSSSNVSSSRQASQRFVHLRPSGIYLRWHTPDALVSLQYADPVADLLDQWGVFRSRLFRESCVFHRGNYVKDLSRLGRELSKVIIIDNSPASYIFHPENAVSHSRRSVDS